MAGAPKKPLLTQNVTSLPYPAAHCLARLWRAGPGQYVRAACKPHSRTQQAYVFGLLLVQCVLSQPATSLWAMCPCARRHLAQAEPTPHTIDRPVTGHANGQTGEGSGRAGTKLQPEGAI